jgi:hypothetical protein
MGSVYNWFSEPTQTRPKLTQTDPFVNMRPQQQEYERMLRGATTGSRAGQIGSPFAAPGGQQLQALQDLAAFTGQSMPLYRQSVAELGEVAGGAALDPTQTAPYQRYRTAQESLANQLFGERASQITGARPGAYNTSTRLAQIGQAAGGTAGQAGQRVGQAGFGLYGAERGRQEAAANAAMNLAPELSEAIFGFNEQLRRAEQEANIDQMRAQLQGMGLDQQTMDLALMYLRSATGEPQPYIQGPSPWEMTNQGLQGASAINWGGPGQQPAAPYGGTIYAPSGGWATPKYQE